MTNLLNRSTYAVIARADPDGGYDAAYLFAQEIIDDMSNLEIIDFLFNIANGEELIYNPDYMDFTTDIIGD